MKPSYFHQLFGEKKIQKEFVHNTVKVSPISKVLFVSQAVYYTVIKFDGHLRAREKCRKHGPQVSVFYIFQVF